MKLKTRFALNLLAPAPIASVLLLTGATSMAAFKNETSAKYLQWILPVVVFAYIFAGVPSLLHASWLHRQYKRGVRPCSAHALRLSTMSGLMVGCALGGVFAINGKSAGMLFIFAALGAATGLLCGILQFLIREQPNTGP